METICYWPHGTWCYEEDLEDYSHLSDDFGKLEVPTDASYDDIERAIESKLNGIS